MNAATMFLKRSIKTDEELRNVKLLIRDLENRKRQVNLITINVDGFEYQKSDFEEGEMMLDSISVHILRGQCEETISAVLEVYQKRPKIRRRLF